MRTLIFLLLATPCFASGLSQLKSFLSQTQSFSAGFSQSVNQKNGKPQQASGSVAISRPGKFDWLYQKPYAQRVIGDGKTLWIYDPDLNQVTRKSLDQALGDSPAALLAGSNELEKSYIVAEHPASEGLEWIVATPKNKDSGFDKVKIGFKDNLPAAMQLNDSFGQTTHIQFSQIIANPKLDPARFRFSPPKGADVVSAD